MANVMGILGWWPLSVTSSDAIKRTGYLALLNIMPLFISFDLSHIADSLYISLRASRDIHRLAGLTAICHIIAHLTIMLASGDYSQNTKWTDDSYISVS